MLKFLEFVRTAFWIGLLTLIMSTFTMLAVFQSNLKPTWKQVMTDDNISKELTSKETKAVQLSRNSAVKLMSMSMNIFSGVSTMSGTYFEANDRPYVMTVYHGIMGPCFLVMITHADHSAECKEYVVVDEYNDYIIMELKEKMPNRTPVKIPDDLPRGNEWKGSYSILSNIIYTGYPNTLGPLTLRGDVVGYNENEYLYVFSHAYGGASGSGVFSKEGKYIGYIVAIDVGSTDLGPDVLENIVIVAPSLNIDWAAIAN